MLFLFPQCLQFGRRKEGVTQVILRTNLKLDISAIYEGKGYSVIVLCLLSSGCQMKDYMVSEERK